MLQVSFEAPPGVKRNLQRTYDAWGASLFNQASPLQAQLLFMLAWFHAIVQERRAYMPQASLATLYTPELNFSATPAVLHYSLRAMVIYLLAETAASCSDCTLW